ncbi:MAG: hypothetical protein OXG96_07480 [Acidobacteria bacterium]|nr:hypothetical protein [Acidobacteriota bacterium]
MASVTVGSGEIVFPSRGGALFGYQLLWIYPAVALLKWGMAYASMRHMILSGAHPFQRWTHLPGPRGWLPLAIVAVAVLCLPLWYSWLSGILGTHSAQISGYADHCFWATLWVMVALALLWRGGYRFLEKAQLLILAIMLLAVLVAVFYDLAIFLAFFGILLGGPEMAYRLWSSYLDRLPALRRRINHRLLRAAAYGWTLIPALLRLPELRLENSAPEWQEGVSLRTPKSLAVRFRGS